MTRQTVRAWLVQDAKGRPVGSRVNNNYFFVFSSRRAAAWRASLLRGRVVPLRLPVGRPVAHE
ncbi:MAG: hypothetical protein ACRDHF_00530 [Tepidiformaceae bacterium]